jgi:hypothetical protein
VTVVASVAHDGIDLADWLVRPGLDWPQYARASTVGRNAMQSMRDAGYGLAVTLSRGCFVLASGKAEGRALFRRRELESVIAPSLPFRIAR